MDTANFSKTLEATRHTSLHDVIPQETAASSALLWELHCVIVRLVLNSGYGLAVRSVTVSGRCSTVHVLWRCVQWQCQGGAAQCMCSGGAFSDSLRAVQHSACLVAVRSVTVSGRCSTVHVFCCKLQHSSALCMLRASSGSTHTVRHNTSRNIIIYSVYYWRRCRSFVDILTLEEGDILLPRNREIQLSLAQPYTPGRRAALLQGLRRPQNLQLLVLQFSLSLSLSLVCSPKLWQM